MEAFANQVVDLLNGLLWGKILIWLLVGTGLYFTLRLGFIQLRHFGHTFTVLRGSRQSDASGISSFQALCTSLAARVGTGNIAGVAVAITLGGPGAIFWMWVIALVGMATGFAEATLAQDAATEARRIGQTTRASSAAAPPTTWREASASAGRARCSRSS